MTREPSPGELGERLDRFEDALKGLVRTFHDDLEADIRDLKDQMTRMEDKVVWRDTYKSDRKSTKYRLDTIEERQRWTWRASITGVVLPIIVIVVGAILVANLVPA